jgi:3-hydroxyacyl-CoA dehydrogenase
MTDLVKLSRDNDVAIITIDNPPVNALSPGVPEGISEALDRIAQDRSFKAAVLIGGGRTFAAGADIKELGKIAWGNSKVITLEPLLLQIEDSRTPVIVAIHGAAFGGGLELAMAAPYRVALASAKVGQPEVKLGLIPGAAGTQRLPRLAGIAIAVEMCSGGNPISAEQALKGGIIDRIVGGASQSDLLAGAIAFAREVAGKPAPKTRERNDKLGNAGDHDAIFAAAREAAAKKQRGQRAPLAAISAVEAATKMSFTEGCEFERRLFLECLTSEQCKALIHIFFSEREAAKIPDIPRETPLLPIHSAAVVGAGTMGGGIAMALANAGIPVLLKETEQSALDRGLATIRLNYETSVKHGRFTQQFVDQRLALISPTLTYDDFPKVDLVIEAVFENMRLKKEVFKELDAVCKQGAILATNTSTLNIDEIASAVARPDAVVGTHFFTPPNVTRLLEVVRGKESSREVIATCMQLAGKLGKVGVLVGNCTGFVANRMFIPYHQQVQFLLEEGASVEAVDRTLTDFGMGLGPVATMDMVGLDVAWRIRQEHKHLHPAGTRQPFAEDRLCELGRYGRKTNAGWYKYDEQRRPVPDPEVTELVRKWAAENGIVQRSISTQEILDRCLWAFVNEGARILEEGYALRVSDIDTIFVNGYGFPAWRGGPMWYADTVGLKNVYDRVAEFHRDFGELWRPAPLLKQLAEQGRGFYESK